MSANLLVAWVLYLERDYDAAVEECEKLLKWAPDAHLAKWIQGSSYRQTGQLDEALAAFRVAQELVGRTPLTISAIGHTNALSGRKDLAHAAIDELKDLSELRYVPPDLVARVYIGLGDTEKALNWMEAAQADGMERAAFLETDPELDPLREADRFDALLHERQR